MRPSRWESGIGSDLARFEDTGELATGEKYAILYLVTQLRPILCNPMDCSPQGSSVHVDSPEKNTGVGLPCLSPGESSQLRDQLRCPTLQGHSLLTEPPGKPKNTGVGSLSLLQEIFPTQEFNQGLLHCRWILYQLSYQGSPKSESESHSVTFDFLSCRGL